MLAMQHSINSRLFQVGIMIENSIVYLTMCCYCFLAWYLNENPKKKKPRSLIAVRCLYLYFYYYVLSVLSFYFCVSVILSSYFFCFPHFLVCSSLFFYSLNSRSSMLFSNSSMSLLSNVRISLIIISVFKVCPVSLAAFCRSCSRFFGS